MDLKPFVARMERQSGKLIKFIRTDQGGEFSGVVLDFLADKGIVRQKSTPYYHIDPGIKWYNILRQVHFPRVAPLFRLKVWLVSRVYALHGHQIQSRPLLH